MVICSVEIIKFFDILLRNSKSNILTKLSLGWIPMLSFIHKTDKLVGKQKSTFLITEYSNWIHPPGSFKTM